MATLDPQQRLARPGVDVSGTRAEVERLYSEHGEKVYAICASILRDRHEAEDAAQQVFVSALRALRGGAVPLDAAAWLATIARHESRARAGHQQMAPLHDGLEDPAQEDPATTVLRRAELAETWRGIAALPASQREALLLRVVRGLAYEELADDLRLSHASVRSLLSRARHTLRMQLERGAAALTGAQWLSGLTRLFADTSSPTLSSATRTAAVGLGALAIAGGSVVEPTLTHHPHVRTVDHHKSAARRVQQAAADAALIGANASSPTRARADRADLGQRGRGSTGSDRGERGRRDGDRGPPTADRRGRGGRDDGGATAATGVSSGADGSSDGGGSGSQTGGRDSSGGGLSNGGPGQSGSLVGSNGGEGSSGSGSTDDAVGSSRVTSGPDGAVSTVQAHDLSGTSGKGSTGGGSGSSGGSGPGDSSGASGTTVTSDGDGGSSAADGSGGSAASGGSGGAPGSGSSGGSSGSGGSVDGS